MSSPSDAAPDRSSAAGEETKRQLSRKRVTVITATALSLLEACGLEPSPARSEKTAGKGKKATQGEPPAEKASADGLEERQAAGSTSSRERNGGRKKRSAPDRAPREAADAVPQEDASQGVAATKAALPEIPPVIPPADTAAATVPPGPATPPKKTTARRRASGTKAAPVTDTGAVPATEPAPACGSVAQEASPQVVKPSVGQSAVEAAASVPGEDQPHSGARRRAVSRAGRASTSGGRGRKKAAATTPASAGEAGPTTAPVPEQQPVERPMDAAALAAEADRLAAEYGLSSSGGGLVVLPGDDDWDDFPAPPDREASSARTAARGTETVPAVAFPESVPSAAPVAAAAPAAPAPEATPAAAKSSPKRRRAGSPKAAPVAEDGPVPVAEAVAQMAPPSEGSFAVRHAADAEAAVPDAGLPQPAAGRRAVSRVGHPAAPGDARMPEGSPAPVPGAVSSVSAGHRAEGEANGTARPAASPVAGAPCPAPSSGTGMGRREAAFRQWAADMQARFDAGLEAEEDRAARRKDSLVVLPPPTDTGGRKRRTAKKAQAAAAEAPRPRTWITRRRSTEPGHEARFEEWHGPARTGSVLEKVFISLGASPEQAKLSRLWRSWDAVLGPDLAPLARPLGHHDDKLLIGAEDAVLLQELYYMGPEIVRRVNEFLQEDFFTAVKVSLMLDHQDLDAPSPVLERSAGRPKEEVPAPSGASLGLMDPESAVARCYARFLGMELPDPRK